ncbi:hypothetical protein S83_023240, partial [Arachis hypogaea]
LCDFCGAELSLRSTTTVVLSVYTCMIQECGTCDPCAISQSMQKSISGTIVYLIHFNV